MHRDAAPFPLAARVITNNRLAHLDRGQWQLTFPRQRPSTPLTRSYFRLEVGRDRKSQRVRPVADSRQTPVGLRLLSTRARQADESKVPRVEVHHCKRHSYSRTVSWRNIPISLIDPERPPNSQ